MSERFLITLIADPGLEEPLIDWLLRHEDRFGFTSSPLYGHSSQTKGLNLAEQVAGRKRQLRFQLCVDGETRDRLIDRLKLDFAGSGIHYWVLPVMAEGRV